MAQSSDVYETLPLAAGILIVILTEILNDHYLFYPVLAGNNEPFKVTPCTSSG